jgi:uncharacterized phage protein gp47/JayE
MSSIQLKSFNQILGSMVRKIVAETPLSDINPGSVFLSLLEACASNDFENNVAILNVLELLSVDSIRNNDLDNRAADFGLTRKSAVAASGAVSIFNTNISKQSANLYSLKPAPIAGQTVLFVTSTSGWASTGSVYIGRGTTSFEGPIPYTSIQTFATYSQINLGSALQKDHLSSDTVINAQGQPDRLIPASTVVKIPANNQNSEILYSTLRNAIIPAGEDRVDSVLVVAQVPGSQGNALINTIKQFDSVPFAGATVSNTQAFTSGTDVETDVQLRNRIKSYAASLARGTSPAILSAITDLSDPDENKRVTSAVLTHPIAVGSPSILYIDDGQGFQPSYAGQAVDVLLAKANGTEEFLQLANYPLPRPQVVNTILSPFSMVDQMFLRVAVDGEEDTVVFYSTDFVNISVATVSEVVTAINSKSTLFKARLTNDSNNILIYPVDPDAETLQVVSLRDSDDESLYANHVLNFPTNEVSYIALYQNNTRLKQRAKTATVETVAFAAWNLLTAGNLILSVDGTPAQDASFTLADFPGFDSFTLLTLDSWVDAINSKFAGVTAVSTPGQTMEMSSNKSGSSASIEILGGTYQASMFATNSMVSTGQESQFEINRQTGNIRILTDIAEGDTISAGVPDAKGFVVSSSTANGVFNLDSDDVGRQSQMVIVADAAKCDKVSLNLQVGDTFTTTDMGGSIIRIMASTVSALRSVQPGHFLFIAGRSSSWFSAANTGLFRVVARGAHLTAGVDSYIEVRNNTFVSETVTVADVADIAAFDTDVYPQLWRASTLSTPASTTLTELCDSINSTLQGVRASTFRTTSVKLTSATEMDGSIAIPVSVGRVALVFASTVEVQLNNEPLIASKVPQKDMVGFPKLSPITSSNAYLSRASYPLVSGALTSNSTQDPSPYTGTYSETLTATGVLTDANVNLSDVVLFTRGDNRSVMRSIAAKPTSTSIGTQHGVPRTVFNHVSGDQIMLVQSLKLSADDSIVCVMDNDATAKTIDINAARSARVNSGSQSGSFIPTTTEFSADDSDNEAGVDFGTVNVWGTSINETDFSDYAILMRARNWYSSGGTAASDGKLIVRSAEYGPNGNKMRFAIKYPSDPSQTKKTTLTQSPSSNLLSYIFGSSADRAIALSASTTVTVTGPYADVTTNFPAGASGSGNYWDLSFSAGTFSAVQVGDVLSVLTGSGLSTWLVGQYRIQAKSGSAMRIYSRSGVAGVQTISNPTLVHIFPLSGTSVSDIVSTINASNILTAAAVGSAGATITKSTYEEQYTYVSNATALAYGHNPGVLADQGSVALYDGVNWVRDFQNANPNFTTKSAFTLTSSGVASSIYAMHTAPNEDSTIGELFKLVPTTIDNVQHHFTQKAMSQLPILSGVDIADSGRRVQIVAKQLGSAGGIQVLGGHANLAQTDILGDTQVASDASGSYLLANVAAFPNSYAAGDVVRLQNRAGVRRQSRLTTNDQISVSADGSGQVNYLWDAKTTNFTSSTTIAITDVSTSYADYSGSPLASGMVFRWTHSTAGAESLANVRVGDVVAARGVSSSWRQGNLAKVADDGTVSGLPVVAVNDASHYFDVVCPFGKTMSATTIGSGTVGIYPSPRVRWNLGHMAPVAVSSISRTGSTVTVVCAKEHYLSTGDGITLRDSSNMADGNYSSVTTTSATAFTFSNAGSSFSETVGSTILNSALTSTKYRLEALGINDLVRLSYVSGAAPRFADAGVAVDDYIVISGTTFGSLNNGIFRVIAVDNTSVVFENPNAVTTSDTLVSFNNTSLLTFWTSNSRTVTGVAGAFKNLSTGVWVKKQEDDNARYLQVVSSNTGDYATATQITLGDAYGGISGSSYGVAYDQTTGLGAGVVLKAVDDVTFYEGDSALNDDALFVQAVTNASWFSANNSGSFPIIMVGSNPSDHRPFVRVKNALGTTESGRSMSVSTQGFYVVESDANKLYSYRQIANSTISESNSLQRALYMLPDSRSSKFSEANGTYITHMGKFGFDLNASIGTDGYLFYTGLLRRVQRTVDGYGPDSVNFPERRAIGSRIETLPPLIKNLIMVLTITTNQGSTIQDITNNVKSSIIDYVNSLGVGQDVILSAIIAKVMQVRGVAAATFNVPSATEERISMASNEKAVVTADNIGIN